MAASSGRQGESQDAIGGGKTGLPEAILGQARPRGYACMVEKRSDRLLQWEQENFKSAMRNFSVGIKRSVDD